MGLIENKRIRTYLTYAVGEILLVVIGILIAISLNKMKEASDLKQDELKLYEDMATELREDLKDIQDNAEYNNRFLERYRLAIIMIKRMTKVIKINFAYYR